jgi:isoamylase
VLTRRDRMRRNFLATLLLSAGVPMLLGGDEIARTQGGNNNAYCQDNEISWYDWSSTDEELRRFTADLVALRRREPALRPDWYRAAPPLNGEEPESNATVWLLRSDGATFSDDDWDDPSARSIMFVFAHRDGDTFALLLNSAENGVEFTVAPPLHTDWELVVSSDPEQTVTAPVSTLIVRDCSFTLLRSRRG